MGRSPVVYNVVHSEYRLHLLFTEMAINSTRKVLVQFSRLSGSSGQESSEDEEAIPKLSEKTSLIPPERRNLSASPSRISAENVIMFFTCSEPLMKTTRYEGNFERIISATLSLPEKFSDDRRASVWLAGWNVSILIQGTSVLGIPYAVMLGGWMAVVTIIVVAAICCFNGKLLVDCLYEVSKTTGRRKRVRSNYPEIGEAVLPRWGYGLVSVIQVCENFGGCVMYVVLLATVFDDMLQDVTSLDVYEWAVVCTCIAFPGIFITRISVIAWLSMVSVFALLASIATVLVYCFTEVEHMSVTNIPAFDISNFPIGFGIVVFSYCGHAVLPRVEASMKEPKKFPAMLNTAFSLAALVKVLLGVLAVLRFGTETQQVVIENMSADQGFYIVATILVVINVFLFFPICMFVVLECWDTKFLPYFRYLNEESKYHCFWLLLTRSLIFTFVLFMAVMVPHFGLVMAFVGSFAGTLLSFIFPCAFHITLKWRQLRWYSILIRIKVIIFGLLCGTLGLYFSGRDLVEAFSL